jgi:hypothetical protein
MVYEGLDKPQINYLQTALKGVKYRVWSIDLMSKFHTPKITLEEGIKRALNE